MKSVVYYISGHGYGHAVRSCQVIQSLKKVCPGLEFHIRTTAPRWLFRPLSFLYYYSHRIDVGILQKDSLDMRIQETLSACQRLHDKVPRLIEEEIAFIKKKDVRLVIGDIPPLCFEIAAQLSLPSVAITNFTWAWIYKAYLSDFPSFLPLIRQMEDSYRKAALALSLPFSCDLEIFPNRRPVPLISRVSALDKLQARKKFGLPASAKIVLLSFGGFGLERLRWERLRRLGEFFFVTTGAVAKKKRNFLVLPETQNRYEDVIRAADVVVSKPGYGIVADVIAHRVPILYTSRGDFPEYPFLAEALNRWATCEFIPQEELLAGEIQPHVRRLLEKEENWPDVPLNGARVAAERILELV